MRGTPSSPCYQLPDDFVHESSWIIIRVPEESFTRVENLNLSCQNDIVVFGLSISQPEDSLSIPRSLPIALQHTVELEYC
ncbi:hypothetical protein J6590_042130, partial [Homalodisca vitripennis]